jgi:hypothetical protein
MGTGFLQGVKWPGVALTNYPLLAPKLNGEFNIFWTLDLSLTQFWNFIVLYFIKFHAVLKPEKFLFFSESQPPSSSPRPVAVLTELSHHKDKKFQNVINGKRMSTEATAESLKASSN